MVIYNKFGDTVFKRKRRYEKVLYVIYIVIILYIIFGINVNIKLYSSNEEFIEKMLKDSNYYIKYENNNNLVSKIIKNTFNYTKKEKKEVTPVVVNTEVNEPVVYIYNSHQLENYSSNKYEPYNITTSTPFLYMIRECGGIATNAFVDGRNKVYGKNNFVNSNIGIETYVVELGNMINNKDLENVVNHSDLYMKGISESIQNYYN